MSGAEATKLAGVKRSSGWRANFSAFFSSSWAASRRVIGLLICGCDAWFIGDWSGDAEELTKFLQF